MFIKSILTMDRTTQRVLSGIHVDVDVDVDNSKHK